MRDAASDSLNLISTGGPKGVDSFFQSRLINLPSLLRVLLAFCNTSKGSLKSCNAIPMNTMSAQRSHREASSAAASLTRISVSYTHLRAHETPEHLVCRLLLEK